MRNKKTIFFGIVLVVLLLILVIFVRKDGDLDGGGTSLADNSMATATDKIIDSVDAGTDVIVKEVKKEVVAIPDLDREIKFPDNFPEDAQQVMIDKISQIIKNIKNNPNSYDDWISLGLQRKTLGDYEGVKLVWEYAKYLNPKKSLAWGNLGDLYAYYLKDNIKAEKNYLKAIEYGLHQNYLYFKIAGFYTDFLNNKEKAIMVVEQGIEINPNSQDLKDLLTSLK